MSHNQVFSQNVLRYLLISFLLILLLYYGRLLFIPLFYGLFIAIVLYPVCSGLERRGVPRSLAITIGLAIVTLFFAVLVWLVVLQFNAFRQDLPELKAKLNPSLAELQNWIQGQLNISISDQQLWIDDSVKKITSESGGFLAGTFNKTITGLFTLFIVPVFAALFLYNRKDFVLFLEKWAGNKYEDRLHTMLNQTIHTYFHFVKGMVVVYIIVGVLNSLGLLALGIKHAVLFGFLTAIMTMIPYVGIFLSALLPITVAWITKDSIWYPLGVIAIFSIVQYLEANIIFPRVVGKELNVSTWCTLTAAIAGGILWGVSGMILFIPFVGILKMISDYVPEWEALNVLLRRKENPVKKIPSK